MRYYNDLSIKLVKTVDNAPYLRVKLGSDICYLPASYTSLPISQLVRELGTRGIHLTGRNAREAIEAQLNPLDSGSTTPLVGHAGWSGSYFALSSGEVLGPRDTEAATVTFGAGGPKIRKMGSLKRWQRKVAKPVAEHPLLAFAIGAALVPPLVAWARLPSMKSIELVGTARQHGELFAAVYASVSGMPQSGGGSRAAFDIKTLFSFSDDDFELHRDLPLLGSGGALLLANEPPAKRLAKVKDLIRLADQRDGRGVVLADSTSLFSSIPEASEMSDLLATELITVTPNWTDAGGVFDATQTPTGSWTDLAADLHRAVRTAHGTALVAFAQRLVAARAADETALRERLAKCLDTFRMHSGVDQNDSAALTRADTFGIVYGAAVLAREFGVLPSGWQAGPVALAAYKRANAHRPLSFDDLLHTIVQRPGTLVFGKNILPALTPEQVSAGSAFLEARKGGNRLFIRDDRLDEYIKNWAVIKKTASVRARWRPDPDRAHEARQKVISPGQRAPFRVYRFDLP